MKAKLNTLIFSALLLAGLPAKAQFADNRDFRNDDAGIVINNYYDDYDYYYSSRINRFHRSYTAFDYYSPVFTETYWYNYQPYSWGTSIYGRSALGFGFAINFPVYYYGWGTDYLYDYNYGWYDPYYGSSWYWGYDPFYYSFYSPMYININAGPGWGHNHWYRNNFGYNDYRPVFHTTNNYYYNSSPVRNSYRPMPERRPDGYSRSAGTSRKESIPYSGRENQTTGNNAGNANNGNNRNSRPEGNRGNFDRNDRNVNNNGNNNNSRPGGNNGNFDDKSGNERLSAPARTQTSPAASPRNNQGSGRTYTAPSGRSSSERNNATISQGRSSSGSQAARSSGQSSRSGSSSSSRSSAKSSSDSKSDNSKSRSSRK